MGTTVIKAAWRSLNASIAETPPGPVWDMLALMRLTTHVRLSHAGAAETLAELDVKTRLAGLELISANVPPNEVTARVARDTVFQVEPFKLLSDRIIAAWSGMSLKEARWDETNSFDRIRALGRLVGSGVPTDVAGMEALLDELEHDVEVEAGIVAWFSDRPFSGSPEDLSLLGRSKQPGGRLEAIAAIIARQDVSADLAATWLATADAALARSAGSDTDAHNARKAALLTLAGRGPEGQTLWPAILDRFGQVLDTTHHAGIFRAVVRAAAVVGFAPWRAAVERLVEARAYLRHPENYLSARAAAVRALARAARTEIEVDRGNQVLRELGRRHPNPWLALLQQATVAALAFRVANRSPEPQWSQLETWLQQDGLPRPITGITIEEVVRPFVTIDAARALALGELMPSPVHRGMWAVAVITTIADSQRQP